ncbi:hypothetical protein ACI78Q_00335 [Geodermatophilus sp. SYSU D00705]
MDKNTAATTGGVVGTAAGWAVAGPVGAAALGAAGAAVGRFLGAAPSTDATTAEGGEAPAGENLDQAG